jgi:hypothetical protein
MMDSDTFRGIHARLPELGGAVLEATQKLLRNNSIAGPSAQEIAEMFSMPMHPEHPERELHISTLLCLMAVCVFSMFSCWRWRLLCTTGHLQKETSWALKEHIWWQDGCAGIVWFVSCM